MDRRGKVVDMTRQESFKRRVRARMAKTGEKYGAARRVLLEQSAADSSWVSEPEVGDGAVIEATGRGWAEWRRIIDRWSGRDEGHAAIVGFLRSAHGLDGWWAQTVTVGYERITGRRLPYQQADGTFTAGRSKTVRTDSVLLREALVEDKFRSDLFGGLPTELRSRPDAKVLRVAIGPGVAQVAIEPRSDGRAKVTIAHEKLPFPEAVEQWKVFWSDWLEAIDGA